MAWNKKIICTGLGNGHRGCGKTIDLHFEDLFKTQASVVINSRKEIKEYVTFECPSCEERTDIKIDWTLTRKIQTVRKK